MANFLRKIVQSKSRSKSPVKQNKNVVSSDLKTQNNHFLPTNNFHKVSQSQLKKNKIFYQPETGQYYLVTKPNKKLYKTLEYNNNDHQKKPDSLNNYLPETNNLSRHQVISKNLQKNEDTKRNLESPIKILSNYKNDFFNLHNFSPQNNETENDLIKLQASSPHKYSPLLLQNYSKFNTENAKCDNLSYPSYQEKENSSFLSNSFSKKNCSKVTLDNNFIDDFIWNNAPSVPDIYSSLPSSDFKKIDQTYSHTWQTSSNQLSSVETPLLRPRSVSPKKNVKTDYIEEKKFRSKSPKKKLLPKSSFSKTLDYLHTQCKSEGCFASIIVQDTQFLLCKHQLAHVSDYFQNLFLSNSAFPLKGVKQISLNKYKISVSDFNDPPKILQFQWFIECTIPCPTLKSITDNSLETCMRLSKRFAAKKLELRCAKFIQKNVENKPPMMALCWLNWAFKHHFDCTTQEICLPVVARLPLVVIEKHRKMLPERIIVDLIAMKLRTSYQQAAKAFYTIHKIDHFYVEMEKCPRCGRQREQGKVRVYGNPCQKLIGCERCTKDFVCEIEQKNNQDFEAFYQCEHGFWPFNDRTEDCHCQTLLYKKNFFIQSNPPIIQKNQLSQSYGSSSDSNNALKLFTPNSNLKKNI